MADLRLWSKELIIELLEMYKSYPCLWKVKCDEYKNKYFKSAAYKELVRFCKKRGFPEATRDFVVRKIQSLRGSFRKELRKARLCQRQGKVYNSSLWYFDHLRFTEDQYTPAGDTDGDKSHSDEEASDDYEDEDAGDELESKFEVKSAMKTVTIPSCASDSPQSPPSPITSPPQKKRKTKDDCPQPEFFDIGQETSQSSKDLSEFEITGMSIAKKLARMDATQAIYAESLISNVIRRGLLKKLTEDTDLCESLCGKKVLTLTPFDSRPTSSENEGSISISNVRSLP